MESRVEARHLRDVRELPAKCGNQSEFARQMMGIEWDEALQFDEKICVDELWFRTLHAVYDTMRDSGDPDARAAMHRAIRMSRRFDRCDRSFLWLRPSGRRWQ
jgi:hypothetical protein